MGGVQRNRLALARRDYFDPDVHDRTGRDIKIQNCRSRVNR